MADTTYAFGSFRLVPAQRGLFDERGPLRIGSRALDLLIALVEAAGRTLRHDELMARAWPKTTVDEASLRVNVGALRKVLGDGHGGNRFIINVPGRGYSFVAAVTQEQGLPEAAPGEATVAGNNIPKTVARIVGREETIVGVAAQLARHRLITVVGPGGIGKTTVAVGVAERVSASYPDGVWFVGLGSLATANLVSSAIGAALGVTATAPDPLPGISAWLWDKQALIVLDNCEHVVDASAAVAEAIVKAAPRVCVLATSREPLRADGEWVCRLAPLGLPPNRARITASEALEHPAVQLFMERVQASGGEFSLADADVPAVCEICRNLDGLPLALELAAAQVNVFGIHGLAQGLNARFTVLTRGRRTAPARQQSLRATMDWGYDLLPDLEKVVLRRLAVFLGGFSMDEACAIAGDGQISATEVVECVASLATKSLVETDISSDVTLFHLLATTRVYALGKLNESADTKRIRSRHAEYYRTFLHPAEADSETRPRPEWLATYARHLNNVRAALDWAFSPDGEREVAVALTIAAVPLWVELSLMGECRERVEQALAILDADPASEDRARMQLSAALGWSLLYGVGRAQQTSAAWSVTLELAERLDDDTYRLRALWGLCIDQFNVGDVRTALAYARRFTELLAGSANEVDLMMADRILGTALHYFGDQTAARHHIERMLGRYATLEQGPPVVRFRFDQRVTAHYFQARILWLQGFADQAMRVVDHNIEEARAIGHALHFCSVLGQGACPVALLSGNLKAAEQHGAGLLEHAGRHGPRIWHIWAQCFNGLVVAKRGDIANGLKQLRDGFERAGEAKLLPRFLLLEGELAACLGAAGDAPLGLEIVDATLARCERRDERWYLAELLRIKGELLLSGEGPNAAAQADELFRRALDVARRQGALSWELRTATSLASLRKKQGRPSEARALLEPTRARFTEGFATADQRAAKALLEALRK